MIVPAFERLVAFRYLRSRRREGLISVIAGFSLLGICLGVATLIIVLSVMNGFRAEILNTILGVNGHLSLSAGGQNINDFDDVAAASLSTPPLTTVRQNLFAQGQLCARLAQAPRGRTHTFPTERILRGSTTTNPPRRRMRPGSS